MTRNHLSTLRLLNPASQVVAGQQQRRSTDRLIYNLVRPLATDGSEDGIYTIEFTPISASGRSGEVQRLTFHLRHAGHQKLKRMKQLTLLLLNQRLTIR